MCGEGGEEAGERIGEAHWAAGGGSHRPPLGETWHPAPEGERCNLGQQGAQLPQCWSWWDCLNCETLKLYFYCQVGTVNTLNCCTISDHFTVFNPEIYVPSFEEEKKWQRCRVLMPSKWAFKLGATLNTPKKICLELGKASPPKKTELYEKGANGGLGLGLGWVGSTVFHISHSELHICTQKYGQNSE